MAHELGHYAVDELKDWDRQRLARRLVDGGWTNDEGVRNRVPLTEVGELFADAFGAFVLGPAYVASLIWRASAAAPWSSRGEHPGWGWRVRVALAIARSTTGCRWALEDLLEPRWKRSLEAVNARDPVPEDASAIDAFAEAALDCLEECAPAARFDACDDVRRFEDTALASGRREVVELCETNGWAGQPAGRLIGVILNAVWIARMRNPWDADFKPAGQTGLDFCCALVEGNGGRR